jgi:hypothetical protein
MRFPLEKVSCLLAKEAAGRWQENMQDIPNQIGLVVAIAEITSTSTTILCTWANSVKSAQPIGLERD